MPQSPPQIFRHHLFCIVEWPGWWGWIISRGAAASLILLKFISAHLGLSLAMAIMLRDRRKQGEGHCGKRFKVSELRVGAFWVPGHLQQSKGYVLRAGGASSSLTRTFVYQRGPKKGAASEVSAVWILLDDPTPIPVKGHSASVGGGVLTHRLRTCTLDLAFQRG